jgi:prevent-host-death family protein
MNVSATELKTRLGRYLEIAAKEPVFIEKNGRNTAVIISAEEYQKFISA